MRRGMTVRVPGISQHQGDWQSGGAVQLVQNQPLGALDQVWRPTTRDELQQLLREYPERKLRLIGSGLSSNPSTASTPKAARRCWWTCTTCAASWTRLPIR